MRRILFFFILVFNSISILPFPIEPVPLRKLVMSSGLIVIGYVRTFSENENKFNFYDKASIEIIEILKGSLDERFITLKMDIDLACPAPAVYYDSTYTIAFLKRNSKGEFYTNSLFYGSKTLSLTEIEIYKSRIKELQSILLIADSTENKKQSIDWLVKCAENPVTRWEGVYELAPQYVPFNLDKYIVIQPSFQLPNIQKLQLKNILLNIDTVNYQDLGLLDIFLLSDSIEISKWISDKLKTKKFYNDFVASELKERNYFINNDMKKELKRSN